MPRKKRSIPVQQSPVTSRTRFLVPVAEVVVYATNYDGEPNNEPKPSPSGGWRSRIEVFVPPPPGRSFCASEDEARQAAENELERLFPTSQEERKPAA